jgi:hypothetical protein
MLPDEALSPLDVVLEGIDTQFVIFYYLQNHLVSDAGSLPARGGTRALDRGPVPLATILQATIQAESA